MRILHGAPASAGVAEGPIVVVAAPTRIEGGRIEPEQAADEITRLEAAVARAAAALEALAGEVAAAGHGDEAAIFEAQAEMARDPALLDLARTRIEGGEDAVAAILGATDAFAEQLRAIGDALLAARAADLADVGRRIALELLGRREAVPALERPSIVVAEDLAPSVTASLPRDRLLGLALEAGSPTAHAAILARAYGIPAVVGVAGLLEAVGGDGATTIALDGERGEVVLDPDPATARRYAELRTVAEAAARADLAEAHLPAVTRDGVEVTLLANIGTPEESGRAVALGASGVGLFRTEFLFIERAEPPSEEEQVAAYRAVVDAFAPHPVTIRLLDVGGDKPIPYLPLEPEANPFLGVRAIRLAVDRPELFVTQLRASMRAAVGAVDPAGRARVKVMAPMVADGTDVDLLLELAERAARGLRAAGFEAGPIDLGVMLEIPSAILVGPTYFGRLAFASLGTNDLTQYTLAVDRGNRSLGRYQDPLHPAVLRLVREAVVAAEAAGIELSVCGEMAGDPVAALALVGLGIRKLSMAAGSLPAVRRAIRASSLGRLEAEAEAALALPTAAAVRERFAALAVAD
ncbi:MAG: phosphoenolpyruvate-protein phosphotransferase [Chloroflexota bacterium]|nr:MAG: phosphoenolpyruvate-protein phosphotransferase [Chloroflexota bacterium]